ncbi:cytokinesis protein 3 [Choanephora cucurbitarum]|uniref:Cytokinesis protein 3 n=1 Tax=Choanephora cucurbitarum TaxID=101091 RepID=A0A1C7NE72_9FUNG|nr:cytokinesis protein 3 [Choanephora cucurbitarum]
MIDCWLASPYYPQNGNKVESHWFLTKPTDLILTHLPKKSMDQLLQSPISPAAFFSFPYVRVPFFSHRIQLLAYHTQPRDQGLFYISLKLPSKNIGCYVETEGEDGSLVRGLAQCLLDSQDNRICKIKAILPPYQSSGWIKIYAGPKIVPTSSTGHHHQHQEIVNKTHYPLALCVRVSNPYPQEEAFSFVNLYVDPNEFYIQEPQCHQLFPLQTYQFCIKANRSDYRATHHKLAIKSPTGKLSKLMYCPQDQTYDGTVTITETGKWSLICLLHQTGGSYTVANWSCTLPFAK